MNEEEEIQAITKTLLDDLGYRFGDAMEKYGAHENVYEALGALLLEVDEVKEAIQERKMWKVREEMLDVANVCIRWAVKHDTEKAAKDARRRK